MEVGGPPQSARFAQAEHALGSVESRLDPAYDVLKIGRVALGESPITFGTTAVSGLLKVATGRSDDPRVSSAINHAGLAADGVLRGLFYSGGLLHGLAAKHVPWIVLDKAAPKVLAGVASGLSKVADVARIGLLGLGGALGAIRGARAVASANGDMRALYMTKAGRSGVLQAVGSVLLMIKHPITYLAGAGVFGAAIVNDFT